MQKQMIDVLIPAYNVESFIARCLDSILGQTYKNVRIVVNNNGSLDKTGEILKKYQEKHKNIIVFNTKNMGSIGNARNFLLSKIQSPLFTFFDSDDFAEPNYIETLYNALTENKADIAICKNYRCKENKKIDFKKINKNCGQTMILNQHEALAELLSYNKFTGCVYCKLMKTNLIKDASFNENFHYGEDLDFSFKIFHNCKKFAFVNLHLYHYIIRKNSIVTSKFNTKKLTCLDCWENIINQTEDDHELNICARSMHGLVSFELLYYVRRDKYKNKALKKELKRNIKESIPYIRKNKRLPKLFKFFAYIWPITKIL